MSVRMSEEEFARLGRNHRILSDTGREARPFLPPTDDEKPRRSKYGNRRVVIDGMAFDSQHEADYYFGVLVPRLWAGELKCVCRQVPFDLPGGIRYIADFVAIGPDERIEGVYDAKSEITRRNRVYINKRKQMAACWGIAIREV